jgi:hypothetical protein
MLLLVKFRNAAELFWDSLDGEEKRLLVIYAAYLIGSAVLAVQSRSRDRMKREIVEELRAVRE